MIVGEEKRSASKIIKRKKKARAKPMKNEGDRVIYRERRKRCLMNGEDRVQQKRQRNRKGERERSSTKETTRTVSQQEGRKAN